LLHLAGKTLEEADVGVAGIAVSLWVWLEVKWLAVG
jgi:hypothetical protein